ncbi:MAG: family 10 glycosylhydrolase [Muribaculaceae bacterium]|nr:family 10 glycosylhydrolase [Muribaculaceae bacterium]
MKKTLFRSCAIMIAATVASLWMQAFAYGMPKQEFRSAWVATVWALDWPTIGAEPSVQQAEIDRMLDSLKTANFNAVNFQVRSMCDAMYRSSYEPWSSYLTGTRGQDPGYDPLQYVVEGCHKRGMECHAWVNPYRFSTGTDWNTAKDQDLKNNGWLISYGTYIILDPAQQRTIDRIVNVCKEIITNYDVDGILYDDYFYPSGIPTNSTADDYDEWQQSGTTLSFGDWRRDNINRMVRAVYDMIQQERPEVRFGISPAGVAASSSSVASKYGVDPCPAGSDWQYNSIFSDPLAWYADKSIDYMSPQVYWHIGATADFGKITPWWGRVAEKFGRHVFISHSISDITSNATAGLLNEYIDEVELTRDTNKQNAPGSIFYSCKYLYRMGSKPSLARKLLSTSYARPALPPMMPWKEGFNPGPVQNLERSGDNLIWTGHEGVRYTVYAFPATMNQATFTRQVEYLLGMSYETTFTIPEEYRDDYQYAVCVLDRVGNEYDPVLLTLDYDQLDAPVLTAPEAGAEIDTPFNFEWQAVDGAADYTVEICDNENFTPALERVTTTATTVSSVQFTKLRHQAQQYWRVQANAPRHFSGLSEVRPITPKLLTITYPEDGATGMNTTFTAQWYTVGTDEEATLEIATDDTFAQILFSGTSTTGELLVPDDILEAGGTFYARVRLTTQGVELISLPARFTTTQQPVKMLVPQAGGVLLPTDFLEVKPQSWALSYTIEISASETTWGRTRFSEKLTNEQPATDYPASEIKLGSKRLVEGQVYYLRTRTTWADETGNHMTDYSTPFAFYYGYKPAITGDVNGDGEVSVADVTALVDLIINQQANERSDVNGDGETSIADVTTLVGLLMANI